MDEEDNNQGHTQIPLINDLVFDESLPLKAPPKKRRTAAPKRKSKSIPPGYDPDTGDLFGELDDELILEEAFLDPNEIAALGMEEQNSEDESIQTLDPELHAELKDELESVLKTLDSPEDGQ